MEDLIIPHGMEQIVATYGDVTQFIQPDGTLSRAWEENYLGIVGLPFPLRLSWQTDVVIHRIRCHKKIMPIMRDILDVVNRHGLREQLEFFGGCFEYRAKRQSHHISLHAWGVALDFNPLQNKQGTAGTMDPRIVAIFKTFDAVWGGDFKGANCDPMHFQFASGY